TTVSAATVSVLSGTTLAGSGIITGNLTFASGAIFAPAFNGNAAGSSYDQLTVSGAVTLGGATLSLSPGFVANTGATFTLITGASSIAGAFSQGSSITVGGQVFGIAYNSNSVVLTKQAPAATVATDGMTYATINAALGGGATAAGAQDGIVINVTSGYVA